MAVHDNNSNHTKLSPQRLEGFSDAVMAIVITISVLAIKIPTGTGFDAIRLLLPLFLVYAISFYTIGTYWNNHHHLLHATKHISAGIMWANLYFLFWLSLIPIVTTWLGENYQSHWPTALYALVLWMCALAYTLLEILVARHMEKGEDLIKELTSKPKGFISLIIYTIAVISAFYFPLIADVLVVCVSLMWLIPDRRIEKYI